jgi:hypothetical protein
MNYDIQKNDDKRLFKKTKHDTTTPRSSFGPANDKKLIFCLIKKIISKDHEEAKLKLIFYR